MTTSTRFGTTGIRSPALALSAHTRAMQRCITTKGTS